VFEVENIIFTVFLNLLQGYCLQYFYGSFLEGRIRNKGWNGLAVAGLYVISRIILAEIVFPEGWGYQAAVGRLALALGILSVLALGFYKAFHLITVFLVVAFQAVTDIGRFAAVILLGELGDGVLGLCNFCMGHGLIASEKGFLMAVNAGLIGQWILEYLVIALLICLPLKRIAGEFREKEYEINRTELLFILTPAAVGMMICMLLRIIIITMEDGIPRVLYDRYPVLILVLPAILLLSLLSILYGVKLFQDMIDLNRERSSRIIFEKQVEILQEHIEELERIYSGVRSMKHDMKNTLAVIQSLSADRGEKEQRELQDYLGELNRTFERLEVRFKTGNTVVDTILNMKYHEAVREIPDLTMNADQLLFPGEMRIRSYDIGVILGNALDNAIEACRKLKEKEPSADAFIHLSSLMKGNVLVFRVENSFDGRLAACPASWGTRKKKDALLVTDKADKASHGIGLANIMDTAQKYQGTMDYRIEDRIFILSVMMKNKNYHRRSEDEHWSNR